jgi:prepilin-type N-terminal cleavage/methylation domain-containing protein
MPISTPKISNYNIGHHGFSLIEIMVALMLAALVFIAIPSGDSAHQHRLIKSALENLDRAVRFASNESVLRNSVVRLKLDLEKSPTEYTVEYGPLGNFPLPEKVDNLAQLSLAEKKQIEDKSASINQQFTKVEEFEDIKQEIPEEISVLGVATTAQSQIINSGQVSIYFYPTGEKDGGLIFLATNEEMAYLEIEPFLSETYQEFVTLETSSVAKLEDLLQTKMDEVYREWSK